MSVVDDRWTWSDETRPEVPVPVVGGSIEIIGTTQQGDAILNITRTTLEVFTVTGTALVDESGHVHGEKVSDISFKVDLGPDWLELGIGINADAGLYFKVGSSIQAIDLLAGEDISDAMARVIDDTYPGLSPQDLGSGLVKERLINAFGFAEMAVRAVVWLPFRARSATFVFCAAFAAFRRFSGRPVLMPSVSA